MTAEHHAKTDRVERWIDLSVPASEVWAVIGDFTAFGDWYPDIESCERVELEGDVYRHIKTSRGIMFIEKLEETGEDFHRYSIADGPLPVENYLATLTCFDRKEGGCRVYWSAAYDAEDGAEVDPIVARIFETGLEAIQARFPSSA